MRKKYADNLLFEPKVSFTTGVSHKFGTPETFRRECFLCAISAINQASKKYTASSSNFGLLACPDLHCDWQYTINIPKIFKVFMVLLF